MIDIRGNEEATWQELDRGDAKRTQNQTNSMAAITGNGRRSKSTIRDWTSENNRPYDK